MNKTEKPRILVVDDDPDFLDICRIRLSRDFEVHLAFDGAEGIHMATALRPAAILLDLHLPRVSGIGVLEHLQARESMGAIPVLVLTSRRLDGDLEAQVSSLANVCSYLEKTDALPRLISETRRVVLLGRLYQATREMARELPLRSPR